MGFSSAHNQHTRPSSRQHTKILYSGRSYPTRSPQPAARAVCASTPCGLGHWLEFGAWQVPCLHHRTCTKSQKPHKSLRIRKHLARSYTQPHTTACCRGTHIAPLDTPFYLIQPCVSVSSYAVCKSIPTWSPRPIQSGLLPAACGELPQIALLEAFFVIAQKWLNYGKGRAFLTR